MITACSGGGGAGGGAGNTIIKDNVKLTLNQAISTEGLLLQNTASGADNTPFAVPKSEAKTLILSAKIAKGTDYDIKVMHQPEGFSQYCYVEQGKGSYNGGKIALALSCIEGFAKVSTYAGKTDKTGRTNGAFSDARFNIPAHMVFDSKGNLFVVDVLNHQIRKITPEGQVSLFAGDAGGAMGIDDGIGSAAKFGGPIVIAIDKADNLYVGSYNNCVRKITPQAKVTTLAGECGTSGDVPKNDDFSNIKTGTDARFGQIYGMVYDGDNALYLFDSNQLLRKISINDGTVQNFIAMKSERLVPMGLSADKQRLYYLPAVNKGSDFICQLYELDLSASKLEPKSIAGGVCGMNAPEDNDFSKALFGEGGEFPNNILSSASGQFLYLASSKNGRIRRIDLINKKVDTLAGDGTEAVTDGVGDKAGFGYPIGIAQDAQGNLFVSSGGQVIRKIDNVTKYQLKLNFTNLKELAGLVLQNSGNGDLVNPTDIGFGQMKLGDYKVSVKHQSNTFQGVCEVKNGTGTISNTDATVDVDCSAVVAKVSVYAGKVGDPGKQNGSLTEARFKSPAHMVFDSKGNLFVADAGNNQIRKITPEGQVSLFAGDAGGAMGTDDGTGSAATFKTPIAITIDEADNLYVGGLGYCVRKITPKAVVTTLAGKCGTSDDVPVHDNLYVTAIGDGARFSEIYNMVYYSDRLYVFDSSNQVIREIYIPKRRVGNIKTVGSNSIAMGMYNDKLDKLFYIPRSSADCKLYEDETLKNSPEKALTNTAGCASVDGAFDGKAQFDPNQNQMVASDYGRFLFLIEHFSGKIRRIDLQKKTVSSLELSGITSFNQPSGIARDAQGNLYVSVDREHVIYKIEQVKKP